MEGNQRSATETTVGCCGLCVMCSLVTLAGTTLGPMTGLTTACRFVHLPRVFSCARLPPRCDAVASRSLAPRSPLSHCSSPLCVCAVVCARQCVVKHRGDTPYGGHYTSDVLGSVTEAATVSDGDRKWRHHNDSVVTDVSAGKVIESSMQTAYIAYYVLVPPPPRS